MLRGWLESPVAVSGDAYGAPQPRLYSVGCVELPPPPRPLCQSQFIFVFSRLPASGPRSYLILFIGTTGAEDVLAPVSTYVGPIDDPTATDPIVHGAVTQWSFRPNFTWTFFSLYQSP
jgi:hypothetical protein